MTRRGSLAYYLAAWAVGCFSMAVALWTKSLTVGLTLGATVHDFPSQNRAFDLLGFAFFAMASGAALSLLGGLILRKIMAALKCRTPLHWAVVGAVLAPVLITAFAWADKELSLLVDLPALRPVFSLCYFVLFAGAHLVVSSGWWLAIPVGAATAYLLGRIERAFASPTEPEH